ncbi:MAG: histidinol dehydrogenase [Desulfobacterales bacterium]|nr:histidinol dehydrogenase [Desulfobacterales bacterium]
MKMIKEGGHRLFEEDEETSAYVRDMLKTLRNGGMDAVRKFSRDFDQWDPQRFELSEKEIEEAISKCDEQLIEDTDFCQQNVRLFAQQQLATMKELEVESSPGIILGHKHIPMSCVGSYVPGGVYPMFGSAQMSIIPAKVAGVDTVVACTPPVKGEGYYPATINAMKKAGADRIFVLGGVQAFALMAYGMGEVPPADMVCGAGNKFVAEAKRQLFGQCGIDLLAGPTEIGVIADDSADPALVACDILGQAEHDPSSGQILVCLSEAFAKATIEELNKQLKVLPTRSVAEVSWTNNGTVVVADDKDEAIALSDDWAPEHLELHVDDVEYYFKRLRNYGSLFIGEETTVAYGDKSIGTNHILPTSRSARYTGGLWVGKFLKTCTYQRMTPEASIKIGEVTERQCKVERMLAHGITARVRVDRYSEK